MCPSSTASLSRPQALAVVLFLALVGLIVGQARVTYAQISDPFGTLLVSKALALHGTVRLDELDLPDLAARLEYRMFERGGHEYYRYPLGTSLFAAPVVGAAHALGFDVAEYGTEVRLQHWLVVASAVLIAGLLLRVARRLLPFWPALTCAAVFWTGTSLASSAAAALWSHDLAVVAALLVLDHIVAAEQDGRRIAWASTGLLLFAGYLVRPTMALFAGLAIAWIAVRDRVGAAKAATTTAGCLVALAAFSWYEFGELLPPYYRMGLSGGSFSGEALEGLLVSPSRGLFVFSPILVAVCAVCPLARRTWPLSWGWWLIAVGWPAGLVLALSRWEMWWGGGCYGPRLLTDALPGLFLLTLRAWPVMRPHGAAWVGAGVFAAAVAFSTFVHTVQGLYNPWTVQWNAEPSVDTDPWPRFDWRFPQFLHSAEQHQRRLVAYFARHRPLRALEPVPAGTIVRPDGPHFDPLGFDRLRDEGRWTRLAVAELLFTRGGARDPIGELSVTLGTNGRQRLRLELNDAVLFEEDLDSAMAALVVRVPQGGVAPGLNRLRFVVPNPRPMRRGDPNVYGVVVKSVELR